MPKKIYVYDPSKGGQVEKSNARILMSVFTTTGRPKSTGPV